MKSHRGHVLQFLLLFSSALLFLTPLKCLSEPYRNAILLVSQERGCASGILLNDGHIITNAHVTESLCPYNNCKGVTVHFSEMPNEQPLKTLACSSLTIEYSRYSSDTSLLKCSGIENEKISNVRISPVIGKSTITAIGYPGCGALKESHGLVTQESPFHFSASAKGSYGSSGSGVYDQSGALVGIIDQAKSLSELLGSFFGLTDFELRGIDAREINALLSKDFSDSALKAQIQTLLEYYRSSIRTRRGAERLSASFDFTARVDWLAREYNERRDPKGLNLISLGGYFSSFESQFYAPLAPLIAAYIIESRGLNFAPWTPLNENAEKTILEMLNEPQKREVEELFTEHKKSPYRGIEMTLLLYGVILMCVAFIGGFVFVIFSQRILRILRR